MVGRSLTADADVLALSTATINIIANILHM